MATKNFNYKQELTELKQRLPFHSEDIAVNLLGKPNKYLSNNYILRWQEDGKIAMKIKGNKAGIWYDFSRGEGGDLFTLVQREKHYDFSQAKQYLQEMVEVSNYLRPEISEKPEPQLKIQDKQEKYHEISRIKRVQDLYHKSSSILYSTENNVAKTYLSKHRGIKGVLEKLQLSQDLRINMMWDNQTRQYYPALIAFARDKEGKVTGGQSIYLDKNTGAKADIAVDKRSFGKISGSFVNIQQEQEKKDNVTIIAEGIETALSLQEAGIKGTILCSLGVNNIKNYQPSVGEKILIAADNDGKDSVSLNTVNKAKEELIDKGAVLSIVISPEKGDFNDMLKVQGAESIKKTIEPEITKLATNLWILKPEDNKISLKFEQQIISLKKFATLEHMNTVLQIYEKQDIQAFFDYSNRICASEIEQKITKDLQIMKNKFDPNHDFGNVKIE